MVPSLSDVSVASLCHEALQKVFRSAFVAHVRRVFHDRFEDAWRPQLVSSFGEVGWSTIVGSVERGMASGSRDAPPDDEFDFLDVADLHAVAAKHFGILFPRYAALGTPAARHDARQAVLRRIKTVTDARNALAHPTTTDLSAMDAAAAMADARKLLRQFDDVAAARVEDLVLAVLRTFLPAPLKESPITPEDDPFTDFFVSVGPDEFFLRLVRFMHDLADMFDDGLVEDARASGSGVVKRNWPTGPEEVALAIEKAFFFQKGLGPSA